jgi:hypothetical protein
MLKVADSKHFCACCFEPLDYFGQLDIGPRSAEELGYREQDLPAYGDDDRHDGGGVVALGG